MHVYFDRDLNADAAGFGRHHPWTISTRVPEGRYYDLVREPTLIRTALEDLRPLDGTDVAESIYEFLEWANGPHSLFETNECGIKPIKPNMSRGQPWPLVRMGRFAFLVRDAAANTDPSTLDWLGHNFEHVMRTTDIEFPACFAYWYWPHLFTALGADKASSLGQCIGLMLWAWGTTDAEVDANFARAMRNLLTVLAKVQALRWPGGPPTPPPSELRR